MSLGLALSLSAVLARSEAPSAYVAEILEWQEARETRLKADNGWLTVAGLFWLEEGEQNFGSDPESATVLPESAPFRAGSFIMSEGKVRVRVVPGVSVTCKGQPVDEMLLTSDAEGEPDVLVLGDLRLFLIKRSKGHAIRMRHLNAPARRDFTGLDHFPVDPGWRIEARFVAYDSPKRIPIANVVGSVDTALASGYLEFERDRQLFRLDPIGDSPESETLFIIFKDQTSGRETYPPGRFLVASRLQDGRAVIDFNRAYNPPCAFTDHATCPLPPPGNQLPIRVTAGEKLYRRH
jgi:uncharacterized protein (DUF1684 family)